MANSWNNIYYYRPTTSGSGTDRRDTAIDSSEIGIPDANLGADDSMDFSKLSLLKSNVQQAEDSVSGLNESGERAGGSLSLLSNADCSDRIDLDSKVDGLETDSLVGVAISRIFNLRFFCKSFDFFFSG